MHATLRLAGALLALALLAYFSYQLYRTPHVAMSLKYGTLTFIGIIGIAGVYALITLDDGAEESARATGERTYTASEVADLINALKVGRVATAAPPVCKFCQGENPEVRGLDGTSYHQRCFHDAYRSGRT